MAEEDDELSAPAGSKSEGAGDRKVCYRFGPRARQTIGAPAVLAVVETLAGACYVKADLPAALGVELVGVDQVAALEHVAAALDEKEERAAKAANAKIAAIEGGGAGAGGGGKKGRKK